MNTKTKLIVLLGSICLIFLSAQVLGIPRSEGFTNNIRLLPSKYPQSATNVIIQDEYDITGKYGVMGIDSIDVYKQYPIYKVGSFTQMTNNIRYPVNVDTGRCMPVEFCDTLYKPDKSLRSKNIQYPLDPAPIAPAGYKRVNYYLTPDRSISNFRTNMMNILY